MARIIAGRPALLVAVVEPQKGFPQVPPGLLERPEHLLLAHQRRSFPGSGQYIPCQAPRQLRVDVGAPERGEPQPPVPRRHQHDPPAPQVPPEEPPRHRRESLRAVHQQPPGPRALDGGQRPSQPDQGRPPALPQQQAHDGGAPPLQLPVERPEQGGFPGALGADDLAASLGLRQGEEAFHDARRLPRWIAEGEGDLRGAEGILGGSTQRAPSR
jgi:hypothetical protein